MKKNIFTILFLSALTIAVSNNIFAQKNELKKSDKWQKIYSDKNIKIQNKFINCTDEQNGYNREYFVFKLTNKAKSAIQISFDVELYYDGKCINCKGNSKEFNRSFKLLQEEELAGDCNSERSLRIFSRKLDTNIGSETELTNVILKNVKTTIIKE